MWEGTETTEQENLANCQVTPVEGTRFSTILHNCTDSALIEEADSGDDWHDPSITWFEVTEVFKQPFGGKGGQGLP